MKRLICSCILAVSAHIAFAVPQQINYQGQLTLTNGSPLDTTVAITFRLYNVVSGGTSLWTETHPSVAVTAGLFQVLLGSVTTLPDSFTANTRWLGVTVGNNTEMTPRRQIATVPYAYRVGTVDGASGGNITSDVSIDNRLNVGSGNTNSGSFAIVHGQNNRAHGNYSAVAGGGGPNASDSNSVFGTSAFIGGGIGNTGYGTYSVIGGGQVNTAGAYGSGVAGGAGNSATGIYSHVGGGYSNDASGWSSAVAGGASNAARGTNSFVGGGGSAAGADSNSARGDYSVIPGGRANETAGMHSLAAGYRAKALHHGAFVWADSSNSNFASTQQDQFLIRASGGVGVGLNNPAEQLEVNGDVKADTFRIDQALRFSDGTIQTTAPVSPGPYQQDSDTNSFDATRTWVQSMGYLKGANNVVSATGNVGGGDYNKARGSYAVIAGGGSGAEADSNSALGNSSSIGGGRGNVASGTGATVGGGEDNISSSSRSVVAGGIRNTASNNQTFVGGGSDNLASATHATIAGGGFNMARGAYSFIGSGGGSTAADSNSASGAYSFIGSGFRNLATDSGAIVVGGVDNKAIGKNAIVGGGGFNLARGNYSYIGGGGGTAADSNSVTGTLSSIVGGAKNSVSGGASTVGGGYDNVVSGDSAVVAGGALNQASGDYSVVGGGIDNRAQGVFSTIAGGGRLPSSPNVADNYATIGGGYSNVAGEYATIAGGSNNQATYEAFVGGGSGNISQIGSSVCGGTANESYGEGSAIGGGTSNLVSLTAPYSVIAGGYDNFVDGQYSTIAGGLDNSAGVYAFTGGGAGNVAGGDYSVVAGGRSNIASARYAFAAGRNAIAGDVGSFVWADSTNAFFQSTAVNQFSVRASGGYRLYSNAGLTQGVTMAAGASGWTNVSDSTLKRNRRNVDTKLILEKVSQLPIQQWSYEAQDPSIEHIGPMAQDFWREFHLGDDSLGINQIDPDGIALAAIQELAKQNEERKTMNEVLKKEVQELRVMVQSLIAEKQHSSLTGKE